MIVMVADPSALRVKADLNETEFTRGCDTDCWRIVSFEFPILDFAVSATEPDGSLSEYGFRAELSNFPSQPPEVRIWDHSRNLPLERGQRPKGGERVRNAFKHWGPDTVYRPWDRNTGLHNNNAETFPHLAWNSERRLVFIFNDLYGILNSNARTLD